MSKLIKAGLILILIFSLSACGGSKEALGTITQSDAKTVKEQFEAKASFILVADWSGDKQSSEYLKVLNKYIKSNETTIYYIPADDLEADYKYQDLKKDYLGEYTGTIPATYFISEGECVGSASGVQTESQLEISSALISSNK